MTERHSAHITGILVERLFGLYDYAMGSYGSAQSFEPGLIVLYGDNGSGKTTLLRLIYHTLSKETNRGHRTALGKIPLKAFRVRLDDGTEVGIVRDGDGITGGYRLFIARPGQQEVSCVAVVDAEGTANAAPDPESRARWNSFMGALSGLNVALYYLSDNRRPEHDSPRHTDIDVDLTEFDLVLAEGGRDVIRHRRPRLRKPVLDVAISDLEELLRHEALSAANIGEANINSIYTEIAKRVLRARGQEVGASEAQGRELVNALKQLMEDSRPFSQLGLLPALDFTDLIGLTNEAKVTTKRTLAAVLQPYVESVTARLDALRPTQQLMDTLVGTLNGFYTQKRVSFDLRQGLRVSQPDGTRLSPQALSSGEQQLLLLFCNTVRARSQATIFIIDEPELSLNVKWQRRLIDALLDLVAGSRVQFVIATHSIELLAKHRDAVVRLGETTNDKGPGWSAARS